MSNYIYFIDKKTEAAVLFRNKAKSCLFSESQGEGFLSTGFEDQGHNISFFGMSVLG